MLGCGQEQSVGIGHLLTARRDKSHFHQLLSYSMIARFCRSLVGCYEYIYFRLYSWQLRLWGGGDNLPEWNITCLLSLDAFMNLMSVGFLISILARRSAVDLFGYSEAQPIVIILGAVILHYLFFIRNKRFIEMADRFEKQDDPGRIRRYIPFFYTLGTPTVWLILYMIYRPLLRCGCYMQ